MLYILLPILIITNSTIPDAMTPGVDVRNKFRRSYAVIKFSDWMLQSHQCASLKISAVMLNL